MQRGVIEKIQWQEYKDTRDMGLRNEILLTYVPMVKYAAARLASPRGCGPVDLEDMMGWGVLGLMDAIEKFDPDKGVKFETYASLRIRGTIIDHLRKQDWVPRSVRVKLKELTQAYDTLGSRLGRAPEDEEVARHLGIPVQEMQKVLDTGYLMHLISLDEQLLDISAPQGPHHEDNPAEAYEEKELRDVLAVCLDTLPEKEKLVLTLYYYEELNFKEIGAIIGVSESRVCQIHSKAVLRLKGQLSRAFQPV